MAYSIRAFVIVTAAGLGNLPGVIMAGLGLGMALIELNPFYGLLEIVRAPLLGQPFNGLAWVNALSYSAVLLVISFLAFES